MTPAGRVRRASWRRFAVMWSGGWIVAASAGCAGTPWLVDVAAEHGLVFTYDVGTGAEQHMPEIAGGGVALFDADQDGDLDVYVANGNGSLPGVEPDPARIDRLFRREADGSFRDVTADAGLGDDLFSMGVSVGDYDNDGDDDLFVANFGPDRLYRNRGDGTFEDVTAAVGIDERGWTVGSVFFDYDRDGWLDLFITQYVQYDPGKICRNDTGTRDWCGPSAFPDRPDILLRNVGGTSFVDVSQASGVDQAVYASLGVMAADFDDDGWLDLYVANDGDPNVLWRNNGDGTFSDVAVPWGVAVNDAGAPEASMGLVVDDLTGDAQLDIFITHLFGEKNTLYRQLSQAAFADQSVRAGLAPIREYTGFGTVATDLELDGDLDLVVANGRVNSGRPALPGAAPPAPWDILAEPNWVFTSDGNGQFEQLDARRCGVCERIEVSRGMASGDIDGDGDEDMVVVHVASPMSLYENRATRRGHWLAVRPFWPDRRRADVGAVVTVRAGGKVWRRTVHVSQSYASARPPVVHFGLGQTTEVDGIEVRWTDGRTEHFAGRCVDCAVQLDRGTGRDGG